MRLLGSSWMKSIKIYSALPCTIEFSPFIQGFTNNPVSFYTFQRLYYF